MTDKAPFDLDAALSALSRDERLARPAVSGRLLARVLADAATVSADRLAMATPVAELVPQYAGRSGGFRLFGLFDAWAAAAVAAVVLCLFAGIGVGYQSGPDILVETGLGSVEIALAGDAGDADMFSGEDVL